MIKPLALDLVAKFLGIGQQAIDLDTLTGRSKRLQPALRAIEHFDRTDAVGVLDLITRQPDLQDAAIQFADRARFGPPHGFERFVLLKVLSRVEFGNGMPHPIGQRLCALIGHAPIVPQNDALCIMKWLCYNSPHGLFVAG